MATKYWVVKFYDESKPHRFIYVPHSWVKTRRQADNMVGVAYPAEDPRVTERRILNNEDPADDWEEHCCEEICTTNEHGDAKLEAMIKNHNHAKENPVRLPAVKRKSSDTMVKEAPPSCKKKLFDEKWNNPKEEILELATNDYINEVVLFLESIQKTAFDLMNKLSSNKHSPYISKLPKTIINAPPEYNEHCTRWTLKYQNPGLGLQELVPGSPVYIRRDQDVSISKAEDYSELISVLLENIFTENALSCCKLERTKLRLDKDAVNAMLEYVTRIGHIRGWGNFSLIDLKQYTRKALQGLQKNILNKTKRFSLSRVESIW